MGTHRLIIGETGASSAGGADTLLSEKAFYLAGTDKQGKTKIQLLCLVGRSWVFFPVGESYGPLVRMENAKIIQL